MTTIFRVLLALALLLSTSCASMFNGTTDEVHFASTPEGAQVFEGTKQLGTTPCTVAISRSTDVIAFEHPAHGRRVVPLKSDFQLRYLFLDILFTPGYGLLGIIVDSATQAWWDHPATLACDFTKPIEAPKKKAEPEERIWPGS